jgi:hypothetical protein
MPFYRHFLFVVGKKKRLLGNVCSKDRIWHDPCYKLNLRIKQDMVIFET